MSGRAHPLGHCTCRTHTARPWNRPEHWTSAEVVYLEARFGLASDAAMAKYLGRSIVGIRLKATRLGLRKRDVGMSSRAVARFFGIDETIVSKVWIRRGLLRARRGCAAGVNRWMHVVSEAAVQAFIREHGQYIDLDKVPTDSPFRDLVAEHAFVRLPEVVFQTGHAQPYILAMVRAGTVRAARRGTWWYVRKADVALIPHLSTEAATETRFRRESVLEARRNRRKGVRRVA